MTNLEIFCVTNKPINALEQLNFNLVGVTTSDETKIDFLQSSI